MRAVYTHNYNVSESDVRSAGEVARKYQVRSTPTILFLDAKGEIICRTRGFRNGDDALSLSLFVQKALIDPYVRATLASNKTCGRV